MLRELRVKNFAIVEDGILKLDQGMTTFTGETGAGKSLLLDAITLLLGSKAHSNLVRSGAKCAEVEGVFDLSRDTEKQKIAESLGFPIEEEDSECLLVRREISTGELAKNRIWIQGKSATRAQLQSLLGTWVEVSGQHEFLRLGKESYILSMVDQFASLKNQVKSVGEAFQVYQDAQKEWTLAEAAEQNRNSRLDYLKFQLDEFRNFGMKDTLVEEEIQWNLQKVKLGNVERIRNSLESAQKIIQGDSDSKTESPMVALQLVSKELRSLSSLSEEYQGLFQSSLKSLENLEDFSASIDHALSRISVDPEALEIATEKVSQLLKLKRKFSVDTEGLLKISQEMEKEFEGLSSGEARLHRLQNECELAAQKFQKLAEALHVKRDEAAKKLEGIWQKDIRQLGMEKAVLNLTVEKTEEVHASGCTRIFAGFSANSGEATKPLGKVASGGELSRIMLALKNLVAERAEIGVYLFDEVDAGIGGETAQIVGARLRKLATDNQVLCVTHLAQIASQAHSQFRIHKKSDKGRTRTFIEELSKKDREVEIARMLGDTDSKAALGLAKELLQKGGESKARGKRSELSPSL